MTLVIAGRLKHMVDGQTIGLAINEHGATIRDGR
jgi:hypothetical protein